MKVAKRVADYPHDTRMIAAYAKLARASATQFETMAVLKGKRRSTRQQITVTHEKHIHHHQHVHLEGGADETGVQPHARQGRSEEHTSELQSLMRISYAVFCLKKKKTNLQTQNQQE